MSFASGTVTAPASTGLSSEEVIGFSPDAILMFATARTAAGSAQEDLVWAIGMSDGTTDLCCGAASQDDAQVYRSYQSSHLVNLTDHDGNVLAQATLAFLTETGFILNWSSVDGNAYIVHYVAFSADNVKVGRFTASGSTGSQAVTGVGFQPNAILTLGGISATWPDSNTNYAHASLGAASSSSGNRVFRWVLDSVGGSTDATDATAERIYDAVVAGPTTVYSATLSSFDADGFTVSWVTGTTFEQVYMALEVDDFYVANHLTPTSTGEEGVTGVGFEPDGVLLLGYELQTGAGLAASLGTTDGTNEGHIAAIGEAGLNSHGNGQVTNITNLLTIYENDTVPPTGIVVGEFVSFDADGLTIDWTTVDTTAQGYLLIAINSSAPSAAPTVTVTVTRADMDEDEVREGTAGTIVLTINNSQWDADIGSNAAVTEDLICGLDSDGTEALGWNNIVRGGECYSAAVLADSPAGYWRLGDSSGDASDQSGNANDGTYENFQKTGLALIPNSAQLSTKFDEATAKVSVTAASEINDIFDSGGTLEAIIRPWSDGGGDQGRIFAKNDTNGGFEFTVYEQNAGFVRLQFRHDFSTTDGVWVTTVAVPLAKANHVAVTYNNSSTSNTPTIYINGGEYSIANGGLISSSDPVGTRVSDSSSDLYIGNTAAVGGNLHFRGEIQEAAVYKSVLTKAQLLEHLKAASNPFGLSYLNVARTSDTVVTITLPAFALYDISETETVTVTVVGSTHVVGGDVTGSPTFDITPTNYTSPYQPPSGDPGGGGPGTDDDPDGSTGGGGPGDGTGGGAGGTGDYGDYNGGLGTQSPQANRVLGEGDDYQFGLPQMGVGLAAEGEGSIRVLRLEVAEIAPTE